MHEYDISWFQKRILAWYALNKRDFPRRDTFDPYKVFVSETMSQQTQVERVVPKFDLWMKELPDLVSLAEVDKTRLLQLWSWLWFNSRAIRLQNCAKILVESYNCCIPKDREALLWLPGIWPYTSASILAFAYNIEVPVVDTNIRRVLIRELWCDECATPKELEKIARDCIPKGKSNDRHNALMDYGATVATARATWIKAVSKQSKFAGSPRQTRGKILKYLLEYKTITEARLRVLFPHKKFDDILLGLAKDEIIMIKNNQVSIAQ